MSTNLYLRRIKGRYVFRRRVPHDLVDAIGKREIVRSLGTTGFARARERARALAHESDALFAR
ncbi:MAG: hypothetical protein KDG89_05160 [Geminicoccaceae bacterium]|nr:hypothetical protein [Geminicoccaceae bacterium]